MSHIILNTERRNWLKTAAALATASGLAGLPRMGFAKINLAANPFTLGVASGSPTHNGMVLWTRLFARNLMGSVIPAQDIPVQWEIAQDSAFKNIVAKGEAIASPSMGHAVHVELDTLPADLWFFYRFKLGEHVSATGRTRTMPARTRSESVIPTRTQGAGSLRIAYASCQRYESGYFGAYAHMVADKPDLILFLGDYIYEYSSKKSRSNNVVRELPSWVTPFGTTVADYRERYAAYKLDPNLQAAHAACPWVMTWDDHEVYNDYAATQGEDLAANFMQRKAAAYQAYYEHMPIRASTLVAGFDALAKNGELKIYGTVDAGNLARIMVLDDRQYRDVQSCPKPNRGGGNVVRAGECPELFDAKRTLLGAAQEKWLGEAFAHRDAKNTVWNLIAQQTLVSQRNYSGSKDPAKALFATDNWDGYPAARQRMLDDVAKYAPNNPVFVGGDIHQNYVSHVKANFEQKGAKVIATEFCGTSISSTGGKNDKLAEVLANNPHIVFADAESRGYGLIDFYVTHMNVALRVVDDVAQEQPKISTLAAFRVQAGNPKIERVK